MVTILAPLSEMYDSLPSSSTTTHGNLKTQKGSRNYTDHKHKHEDLSSATVTPPRARTQITPGNASKKNTSEFYHTGA